MRKTFEELIEATGVKTSPISGLQTYLKGDVLNLMKQVREQSLIEAAKKATINIEENRFDMHGQDYYTISKESILNLDKNSIEI